MIMKFIASGFSILLVIFYLSGCGAKKEPVPECYLGHVDLILDTNIVKALAEDKFITGSFGLISYDTIMMVNKKSYDMMIFGQENFLHISQARGFYSTQAGGLNVIIESKKPGMKDSLINAWKKFTPYSIEVNSSKGQGFELDEVLPVLSWTNIQSPRLIPFLTTYSPDSYKTWGLADSAAAGVSMKTLISTWTNNYVSSVLFKKIDELYVNATQREKEVLVSALLAAGFEQDDDDEFTDPNGTTIFIQTKEGENFPRTSKIKFKLSRTAQPFEKFYGSLKVTMNNDEGWFYFE